MRWFHSLILLFLLQLAQKSYGQKELNTLRSEIQNELKAFKGTVGLSILHAASEDSFHIHNEQPFPMQSVYKLPLAIKVLSDIDSGLYSINTLIEVTKNELSENTWSPMKEKYGDSSFTVTIDTLLHYAVSYSDNIACDVLFKLAGGPKAVNAFMHSLGLIKIQIKSSEKQMHRNPELAYDNFCYPSEMNELLRRLQANEMLSTSSTNKLLSIMTSAATGANRLMKRLPEGTRVAHKTGTGMNEDLIIACNDVGIITLPDGTHLLISVFIKDAYEPYEKCESLIAAVSYLSYEYFKR
jgi:beta-lactamase class A